MKFEGSFVRHFCQNICRIMCVVRIYLKNIEDCEFFKICHLKKSWFLDLNKNSGFKGLSKL